MVGARSGRGPEGFSLVELLVVIVILGILASVVVFAVGGIGDTGQQSACSADAQTIRTAVEAYRARNGLTTQPTENQLVNGNFLATASSKYNISYNTAGRVVLTGAGPAAQRCPNA